MGRFSKWGFTEFIIVFADLYSCNTMKIKKKEVVVAHWRCTRWWRTGVLGLNPHICPVKNPEGKEEEKAKVVAAVWAELIIE